MTLIVSVSEASLSCASDDGDSGCMARSPDDIAHDDFSDSSLTTNLKRQCSTNARDRNGKKSIKRIDEDAFDQVHDPKDASSTQRSEIKVTLNSKSMPETQTSALVYYQCSVATDFMPKNRYFNDMSNYDTSKNEEISINSGNEPLYGQILKCVDGNPQESSNDYSNLSPCLDEDINQYKYGSKYAFTSTPNKLSNNNGISPKCFEKEQKVKYRKAIQRRSISESPSAENHSNQCKRDQEKKRHSFSSYGHVDKFSKENIQLLDSSSYRNDLDYENRLNNISNNGARRNSIQITDDLIKNIKISLIEEYKNLKKNNSSLSSQDSKGSSDSIETPNLVTSNYLSDKKFAKPKNINKNSKNSELSNKVSCKSSPITDFESHLINPRVVAMHESRVPCSDPVKDAFSTPPKRLETWKNILAEKRNSKNLNDVKNCCKMVNTSNISHAQLPVSNRLLYNVQEENSNESVESRNASKSVKEYKSENRNDSKLIKNGGIFNRSKKYSLNVANDAQASLGNGIYKLSVLNNNTANNINVDVKSRPKPLYLKSFNERCTLIPASSNFVKNCINKIAWQNNTNSCTSDEDDSDYCQTDECGDNCDYSSGEEADKEDDDTCEVCPRSNQTSCIHVTSTQPPRPISQQMIYLHPANKKAQGSRSLFLQAAIRRRHLNQQELAAIQEYSVTSDDQLDSDDVQSHDESMCDISSSWRYGLCEISNQSSDDSSINVGKRRDNVRMEKIRVAKLKSKSLPVDSQRSPTKNSGKRRPESVAFRSSSDAGRVNYRKVSPDFHQGPEDVSIPKPDRFNLRPTMGLQGLQQRISTSRISPPKSTSGPPAVSPRSPGSLNPYSGFSQTPNPTSCNTASDSSLEGQKTNKNGSSSSPRTNCRTGALITRNFSISDDECGQKMARKQVTITRHENSYKDSSEKGGRVTPRSPVDPCWVTWKLGVLQKTVEEVNSRLGESEVVVAGWGPPPQDQNLADQQIHNVRKFRQTLPDLQRGLDDVNDQAARFSAHNIPLSPANAATIHDLNNRWKNLEGAVNEFWRQIAGRSLEVVPLTPAQLAASVAPPWERAAAANKVPYYINHAQETTHWDHPQMVELLDSLSEFNHIKFSAYRTATKLRALQKKLSLDRASLQLVTDAFDEHGLRGQNDRLIDVNDMVVVLSTLFVRIASDHPEVESTLATDLCLNWLLNVYDSQRTGQMRVLSFRIGLVCMCKGQLEEKYRYLFRLIADPNRLVDQRKLGLLLHDCVQVPRQLGEVAAFGGSNIEPSVRSCFTKAGKDRETIEAVHFLTWVQQEPQSLVWLAVLHRVAASESVQHQVKCNICKTYPIVGLRYRCLKCLSFDMCQRCFFEGRSTKSHKITHPMHEYCTATRAGDEMKDFTKALKNKFKSKRSLQKHTKKGYLPVQTVLEGDAIESPCPSPSHNAPAHDMHSRLEIYASRLAEVELRTNSNSTPDSEDEHGLIAQYCQSLTSSDAPFPIPKSPLQIMASTDADQKDELEQMIKDLEEENRALQAEYERLKLEQPSGLSAEDGGGQRSESEMLAEAKLLREHKERLEARMGILEDHNRQLEAQLQRLRQLLMEQTGVNSPNKLGTLQTKSVTASQLATDSPAKMNGHSNQGDLSTSYDGLDQMSEYVRPPPPPVGGVPHMGNLFSRAGDLERAVGSLVASMNPETENGSRSDENDYDNVTSNGHGEPASPPYHHPK